MDIFGLFKKVVEQAQAVSQGVRTGDVAKVAKCGLPGCGTITAGARCDKCSRATCIKHTYFRVELPVSLKSHCPYCVLKAHPELFRDSDGDGDDEDSEQTGGDEPIDAEYERE